MRKHALRRSSPERTAGANATRFVNKRRHKRIANYPNPCERPSSVDCFFYPAANDGSVQ